MQLLEADLNFCLKRIWGFRLSRHAEDMGLMDDAQMGGRINRMSISTVLRKILQNDSLRMEKRSAAILDNDARGCYDRILPSLATLTCMRMGLPPQAAKMLNEVLTGMTHHVYTSFGV